jgi:hypothetical protein
MISKSRAKEIYEKMPRKGSIFFPTGAVFLPVTLERFVEIKKSGYKTDDELWAIYAEWHETVHMLQLVTSPYLCTEAFGIAIIARRASEVLKGNGNRSTELLQLKAKYNDIMSQLKESVARGFSKLDVIETHAVTQGGLWMMPEDGAPIVALANQLYDVGENSGDDDPYLGFLNFAVSELGIHAGTRLLPRLCTMALQTDQPVQVLIGLIDRVKSSGAANSLCGRTPSRFCEWINRGMGPRVSRSLRERGTPLSDHPWMKLFTHYFDDFEELTVDNRVEIMMGLHGANTSKMFRPSLFVFNDGEIRFSSPCPAIPWTALSVLSPMAMKEARRLLAMPRRVDFSKPRRRRRSKVSATGRF